MAADALSDSFRILENIICLKKAPLFCTVLTGELRAIAGISEEMIFTPGQEIVKDKDVGDSMYLIKSGSVAVVKQAPDGTGVELAVMKEGDCFGEMSVIDTEVRSASVVAKSACVLLCLRRDDLHDVLLDYPTIAIEFLKIFVKRLRDANAKIQKLSEKKQP